MNSSPKTPQCASHRGVRLCGVHHTAKSSSAVCITAESITYQVSILIRSFMNTISLWCLEILWTWYCKSQIVQGIFFTSEVFRKIESKDVASTKTGNTDIFELVWLCGVHPTAESRSTVCFLPQSQALRCASHRGVKLNTTVSKSKSLRVSGCF